MKYYFDALKKYFVFSGRARRSEFWYFALFNFIFTVAAFMIDYYVGSFFSMISYDGSDPYLHFGLIYCTFCLVMFVPSLAVLVRRLHDVGKSGWFYFIILIPLIGGIWLLVLLLTDSAPGPNEYGPNPKETQILFDFENDVKQDN